MAKAPRIALVTGATQGLGLALVEGLARQLDEGDLVYATGRDGTRLKEITAELAGTGPAEVRSELFDVSDPDRAQHLADTLAERHGGVDIVFNNAVMGVIPGDDPPAIVDAYTQVNNFGTTRVLRAFGPLLRDGGRLIVVASTQGTLSYLAPVLHSRFDNLATLDDADSAVAGWRDAVQDGSAFGGAWPAFINIPSKVGQVAAVRTLAAQRREDDLARDVLIASVCPGMMNTRISQVWWDVSDAPTPDQAAVALLELVKQPVRPEQYGELVRDGQVIPWRPA
ncbi:SDR family NAD(P)-dependent oxidoreductase [Streptomyces scabiei]|uniref:SDR family NAD(P)-dependent oxidoreductase n=1 Tax=Streptomyces TaxID=1883 RepID=UPI00298F3856|nr:MULTISPECIES: SDR family NAD(P)-dependent oxidoreductase [Streptomyces]MDW8471524.1 SDR family NAD(P)-dependent oxidoreductase [Streptomyces scabiei]MDX2572020.1 SDR family NAD(P)-dependent oxidoreductase [Streptomyces scabiei]MDX3151599.1 SDR family NAD(P)-dependent oxidoreductase [Streptomyces scabiei]MDX3157395.1 SDR family NAD(P)-dependent oxidoreductase [Streptomyces scabiei]MDX3256662.1 SDR family NAD(P)-dependent oxidoreductase [Streptomyces scabiei]